MQAIDDVTLAMAMPGRNRLAGAIRTLVKAGYRHNVFYGAWLAPTHPGYPAA